MRGLRCFIVMTAACGCFALASSDTAQLAVARHIGHQIEGGALHLRNLAVKGLLVPAPPRTLPENPKSGDMVPALGPPPN